MEEKVSESFYRNCANCGRQVLVEKPGDRCYWCGKNASKKEVTMAEAKKEVTMTEVRNASKEEVIVAGASFGQMARLDKSRYIKRHLPEITEDIRNLPK